MKYNKYNVGVWLDKEIADYGSLKMWAIDGACE